DVLSELWQNGFKALFVEGGGRLGSALLAEDRIDWLDLFLAPKFLGGEGVSAFPMTPPRGDGAWALVRTARFQDDVLLELRRDRPATAGGGGT
ncbi:MAG TPA: dihydrofolate reductase family protein, partial [Longimicrobiales bacterium]